MSVIPHTAAETTLLSKKAGDIVNLENDIVGKYVEKLMSPVSAYGAEPAGGTGNAGAKYRAAPSSSYTLEDLRDMGF